MSDYFLGCSLSCVIALLMGIKKQWRFRENGLSNVLFLIALFIVLAIIAASLNDNSSNPFLGLLGILTLPAFLMIKNKGRGTKESGKQTSTQVVDRQKTTPDYINTQEPAAYSEAKVPNTEKTAIISLPEANNKKGSEFPEWYVSISFGKSRSDNFPQALALAKMAPQYIENDIDGQTIYQAIYSAKPQEYLAFIKLYELVSNWKSCFVVINGQMVDRKIIGGLNYCYGDKCRSGNPEFCYGASFMTENPFGCHRIQISAYNNPWWTFGSFDRKGVWMVNKEAMLKRIIEYSEPYQLCPAFSLDRVLEALNNLPDKIDPRKDKGWVVIGNAIKPAHSILEYTININLSDNDN